MRVRPADAGDAPRLAELSGALGSPVAATAMAMRLARVLTRADDLVLVVEAAEEIVGWIHAAAVWGGRSSARSSTGRSAVVSGRRRSAAT